MEVKISTGLILISTQVKAFHLLESTPIPKGTYKKFTGLDKILQVIELMGT